MSKKKKKILGIVLVLVILIVIVAIFFLFTRCEKKQPEVKGVETITYITQLPFNPEELKDITETAEGDTVYAGLESPKAEAIIPPNSKVHLAFETICLDRRYGTPDENMPIVFSYEKPDMPLFDEIKTYNFTHPLDWAIMQDLFWDLSTEHGIVMGRPSSEPLKFDDLLGHEQTALLEVDPDAREKVDSYQHYRDITVKNFSFEGELPEEVVAQPIPGTELYAKVVETNEYYYTGVEVYNPSSEPQVFSMFREDAGILAFVPKGWAKEVTVWQEKEYLTFGVASGKFDIRENIFRTPADSGAVVESEDGSQKVIEPNTELSFDQLEELVRKGDVSWWGRLVRRLFRPSPAKAGCGGICRKDKWQIKVPTIVTSVRG